jgi:hypothetical protein
MNQSSKIIIIGTVRSGSTLLIKLLHGSGIEIGYKNEAINKIGWRGGIEYLNAGATRKQRNGNIPIAIKCPIEITSKQKSLFDRMDEISFYPKLMFLCKRDNLDNVVRSVERIGEDDILSGRKSAENNEVIFNKTKLLEKIDQYVNIALTRDITVIPIIFPKYAKDFEYCFNKISIVVDIEKEKFREIWNNTVDQRLIHFE